jgi:hypothetical protein
MVVCLYVVCCEAVAPTFRITPRTLECLLWYGRRLLDIWHLLHVLGVFHDEVGTTLIVMANQGLEVEPLSGKACAPEASGQPSVTWIAASLKL